MTPQQRVEAAGGLGLERAADGAFRLSWDGLADALGPIDLALAATPDRDGPAAPAAVARDAELRPLAGQDALGRFRGFALELTHPLALHTSVRAYDERPLLIFRLEATAPLDGIASGALDAPRVAWPWLRPAARSAPAAARGLRGYGHQYTEFAFPTFSGPDLASFRLFPHRPAVIEPLWLIAPDLRVLLLAPLDAFHDQVIAVPRRPDEAGLGVRCGWHGDLDTVPAGFASELAVFAAPGPRAALESYGSLLRERHGTRRPSRYADDTVGKLSYWTDNGAAYWYRTEPGLSLGETLVRTFAGLREAELPVAALELDSWFYPHEKTRPVNAEGQEHVPPTPALLWEAREDVLPDGVAGLRRQLGDPPLVLHARHLSSQSPYFVGEGGVPAWSDGERAHPVDPEFFARWCAQAAAWGAITIEQDWLIEIFLGVRGLRERPGRARAWQEGFDRAAGEHGVSLLWCMATPADFLQTVSLENVVAIRTSGDYRYIADNPSLWPRFLYTNALARALGLWPFKDVFVSQRSGSGWDGDRYAEVEALLSALSAGPVGLGDRAGRSDPEIVRRSCRADGVLVKPDVPIAALERCFLGDCFFEPVPLLGECWSVHPAGRWVYLAAFHACREEGPMRFRVALAELGEAAPSAPVLAYDWRRGSFERLAPEQALEYTLSPGEWAYHVLCPLLPGERALFGDVTQYATVGDRRVGAVHCGAGEPLRFEARGAPGETVEIRGYAERRLSAARKAAPDAVALPPLQPGDASGEGLQQAEDGGFRVRVAIPERGWVRLELA